MKDLVDYYLEKTVSEAYNIIPNSVDENDSTISANLSVTMSNYDSSDGSVVLTYSVNSGSTTAESGDYSYSPTGPNELTFNLPGKIVRERSSTQCIGVEEWLHPGEHGVTYNDDTGLCNFTKEEWNQLNNQKEELNQNHTNGNESEDEDSEEEDDEEDEDEEDDDEDDENEDDDDDNNDDDEEDDEEE